jgi:hypothetical protein
MNDELPAHSAPPQSAETSNDGIPGFLDRRRPPPERTMLREYMEDGG